MFYLFYSFQILTRNIDTRMRNDIGGSFETADNVLTANNVTSLGPYLYYHYFTINSTSTKTLCSEIWLNLSVCLVGPRNHIELFPSKLNQDLSQCQCALLLCRCIDREWSLPIVLGFYLMIHSNRANARLNLGPINGHHCRCYDSSIWWNIQSSSPAEAEAEACQQGGGQRISCCSANGSVEDIQLS